MPFAPHSPILPSSTQCCPTSGPHRTLPPAAAEANHGYIHKEHFWMSTNSIGILFWPIYLPRSRSGVLFPRLYICITSGFVGKLFILWFSPRSMPF